MHDSTMFSGVSRRPRGIGRGMDIGARLTLRILKSIKLASAIPVCYDTPCGVAAAAKHWLLRADTPLQ